MRFRLSSQHVPIIATVAVWLLLFAAASIRYDGFFSTQVVINLFRDNAFLGLAAVGMTFVILSGGIDLSVGAMIALTSVAVATGLSQHNLHPAVVIPAVLVFGLLFGAAQGTIISYFNLPPFLVTLGGMFLARGLAQVISLQSISIMHPFYNALDDFGFEVFPVPALVFLAALLGGIYLAHFTRFGRNVYAIGGSEPSAVLMGIPVGPTKVGIYALSGFCSAAGGIVYTMYTSSGYASAGLMLELDAIAAVVIGGTPLTGGIGYVAGTLLGVLILGLIPTIITFEGTLSNWWTSIAIGSLLLMFILLQKWIQARALRAASASAAA